jgi:hypothetical protein
MTVVIFGMEVAAEVARLLDGERAVARWLGISDDPARPRRPESERMLAQVRRLHDIARAQPQGQDTCGGPAVVCLQLGLTALHTGHIRRTDPRTGLYSIVEPVIPLASL